jgi:hypothetical protein
MQLSVAGPWVDGPGSGATADSAGIILKSLMIFPFPFKSFKWYACCYQSSEYEMGTSSARDFTIA